MRAALHEAAALLAQDLRPGPGRPPEAFLRYLSATVPARLRDLAGTAAVRDDPDLWRLAQRLGADDWMGARAALERGETTRAVAELTAAVTATPGNPRPRAELGRALLLAGRRREGLDRLRESCLGWPEIPQCAFYLAEAYAREGNRAAARRAAMVALARDPGFAPAAAMLRAVDAPPAFGQTPAP